jgi:hypothetical protein
MERELDKGIRVGFGETWTDDGRLGCMRCGKPWSWVVWHGRSVYEVLCDDCHKKAAEESDARP